MSSHLIDNLLEQAKALTEEERRILASRLIEASASPPVEKEQTDELSPDVRYRKIEYRWMKEHGDEYTGQWVALEGDRLFAHGSSARQVLEEAERAGAKLPFIARIGSPFVGWDS